MRNARSCQCKSQLGDGLFEGAGKEFFGTEYEKALAILKDRVNRHSGFACATWYEAGNCYKFREVHAVVSSYQNLVTQGKIPEYDRAGSPQAIDAIENAVSAASGFIAPRVNAILWHMYHGTIEGEIPGDILLRPKRRKQNAAIRETPPDQREESFWDKYGGVLLFAGITLGGLYLVTEITENISNARA